MQLNLQIADKSKLQIIKLALAEILEGVVFCAEGTPVTEAEIPAKKFKIGELADRLERAGNGAFTVGGVEVDPQRKTANYKGQEIVLTEIEVRIINFLHSNGAATREELLAKVWGYSENAATRTVETHIHRLNQKMQETFSRKIIESGQGGYRLI